MTPEETKAALRAMINATIKGDPEGDAPKLVHDVLQAKMQARISPKEEVVEPETTETEVE